MKLLLAILEALPILDKWFQKAALAYTEQQRIKENDDFLKALDDAKKKKDTTDLSKSFGS